MKANRSQFDVRRLLRELNKPQLLRRNPLILAHFLEDGDPDTLPDHQIVSRSRAIVQATIDTIGSDYVPENSSIARLRAILRRCDLQGEDHEQVARELGISRRQFYRERQRAIEELGAALVRNTPSGLSVTSPAPGWDLNLTRQWISSLHLTGQFDAAMRRIDALAPGLSTPDRIRAWCHGVEIACDAGASTRALQYLGLALASPGEGCDHDLNPDLRSCISLASARVAWLMGRASDAVRECDTAIRFASQADVQVTAVAEVLAQALVIAAKQYSHLGKPDSALVYLGHLRDVCDRTPLRRPIIRADLAAALGCAHAYIPHCLSLAIDEMRSALAIYTAHNATRKAAATYSELAILLQMSGEHEESLQCGRAATEMGDWVCSGDELAYMYSNCSMLEALVGSRQRALDDASLARERATEGGFVWALSLFALAEARLAAGDYLTAIGVSRKARLEIERFSAERYIGSALRIEADAQHRLGQRAAALRAIGSALEIQNRVGHPYSLMRTLCTSALIQGDAAQERAAVELAASLRGKGTEASTPRIAPGRRR